MKNTRILIAGGYGAVGEKATELLVHRPGVTAVVAGRNQEKARSLATKLKCDWIGIDLNSKDSISAGLKHIDIVINCFIPADDYPVLLAEVAIEKQVNYLDVSAFNGYCEQVLALNSLAIEKGVTLITALGAYPGISGLVLADADKHFEKIDSADFYFAMGGKLEGLTPLSLVGVHYMMSIAPKVWESGQWQKPQVSNTQEPMSEPFNKSVFFSPGMITTDLRLLPKSIRVDNIAYWSGMENMLQGLVFFLGMKLGLAATEKRATPFLKFLKFLGKGKNSHSEMALKAVVKGRKDGKPVKRILEIHGTEDYLTALIPVLICDQLINGQISQGGAFTGPQIVDTGSLIQSLKDTVPSVKESWEPA